MIESVYLILLFVLSPGAFGFTDDLHYNIYHLHVEHADALRCYRKAPGGLTQLQNSIAKSGSNVGDVINCVVDPLRNDGDGSSSVAYLDEQRRCDFGLDDVLYHIARDSSDPRERRLAGRIWSDYLYTISRGKMSGEPQAVEVMKWLFYAGTRGLERAYVFAGDWASYPFSSIGYNPSLSVHLYQKSRVTSGRYPSDALSAIFSALNHYPGHSGTIGKEEVVPRC